MTVEEVDNYIKQNSKPIETAMDAVLVYLHQARNLTGAELESAACELEEAIVDTLGFALDSPLTEIIAMASGVGQVRVSVCKPRESTDSGGIRLRIWVCSSETVLPLPAAREDEVGVLDAGGSLTTKDTAPADRYIVGRGPRGRSYEVRTLEDGALILRPRTR